MVVCSLSVSAHCVLLADVNCACLSLPSDSRKVPVTTTINDLITGDLEGRAKVLATSVGNRNSHVNSPSPSEDEPTLAV